MNHHPANALFGALTRIAQAQIKIPTWEQYLGADRARKAAIETQWCSVGHGYTGDGSERHAALDLYIRSCRLRCASGEVAQLTRPAPVVGEFEEYDGEAAGRGMDARGFNVGGR